MKRWDVSDRLMQIQNVGRIMVDHDLFSEAASSLDDELLGVQGYKFNMRGYGQTSSHRYNRFQSTGRTQPNLASSSANKITMEQAECYLNGDKYEMTDDQALLAPARTKGSSLTEKKFAWLLVDGVSEPEFAGGTFESVAISTVSKDMITELAQHHSIRKNDFDDMVKGIGHGMVISLEGPPGSGKTLTAGNLKHCKT